MKFAGALLSRTSSLPSTNTAHASHREGLWTCPAAAFVYSLYSVPQIHLTLIVSAIVSEAVVLGQVPEPPYDLTRAQTFQVREIHLYKSLRHHLKINKPRYNRYHQIINPLLKNDFSVV